tara:strand:- start:192 stop:629 length:438 start_codon:yes stop_codon:yes gene_type:complete
MEVAANDGHTHDAESRNEAVADPNSVVEHKEKKKETTLGDKVDKGLDIAQDVMTVGGLTPLYGNAIDGVNTGVSAARAGWSWLTGDDEGAKKHATNTAVNAASMIPGAGIVVGGAKLGNKAVKAFDKAQTAGGYVLAGDATSKYL